MSEPIDMLDPTEKADANEPTLPIERTDLSDQSERTECEEPIDQRLVPGDDVTNTMVGRSTARQRRTTSFCESPLGRTLVSSGSVGAGIP